QYLMDRRGHSGREQPSAFQMCSGIVVGRILGIGQTPGPVQAENAAHFASVLKESAPYMDMPGQPIAGAPACRAGDGPAIYPSQWVNNSIRVLTTFSKQD